MMESIMGLNKKFMIQKIINLIFCLMNTKCRKHYRVERNMNAKINHRVFRKEMDWIMEVEFLPLNKNKLTNLGIMYYIGVEDADANLKMDIERLNGTTLETIK